MRFIFEDTQDARSPIRGGSMPQAGGSNRRLLWTVINLRHPFCFQAQAGLRNSVNGCLPPTYMGSRPSMVTRSVGKKGSLLSPWWCFTTCRPKSGRWLRPCQE
jgi:hypothetical protein